MESALSMESALMWMYNITWTAELVLVLFTATAPTVTSNHALSANQAASCDSRQLIDSVYC